MFRRALKFVELGTKVVVFVLGAAAICHADFTPPTVDTANILLIAGAVFTGLAAIWFVKKGIKLLNRS